MSDVAARPVGGTVGDTQGVGGLCLPWGFHAVQTSASGMSHNQTHWLLLNWPAGPSLAHLEASCLKTLPLQFTLPLQLPTTVARCLPRHSTATVTHSRRTQYRHRKNNFRLGCTMGATQEAEALVPGRPPWHVGERCYVLGTFLCPSLVFVLRQLTAWLHYL